MSSSSPFTQWVTSSPELNQFFKSSDPPSASLLTALSWRELGAKAEAVATEELAFIDVVISHPGHSLQSRKGYLQSILINKSILSPIRRLPPEILLIIFKEEQVTVGASADRYYEVTDASRGPWMLSRICRRWRALVISNPTLWSRPVIILNRSATSKATTPPLEVALARSGQSDLSFFLSQSFRQLGDQAGLFREVLNLLVPHSSRWADVVFEKKEWDTIDIGMLNTDIDIALPWNQVMQFQYSMNNRFSTLLSRTEACLDILKRTPGLDHIVDGLLALNQFLAVFEYRNGCSRGDDIPYLFNRLNDASLLPNLSEISLEYRQALTNRTRFGMLLDKILLFAENRIGSIRRVDNKVLVKEWKTLPVFYKFCRDAKGRIDDLAVRGVMVTIDVVADIDGLNDMRERQALRSY
ncbi:hypothetical protein EDD18DRAFT_1110534 [Armillaria luteobubalina]|uniref:F-box domain-containing protein n=1 Tax=Armillaria luteobubalina TaxID=153913 RepID=A0AA39PQ56_9AGAR|nr:hypothetical protein EDD18DRAFT_1110534 [Armillaria luteobubalina]